MIAMKRAGQRSFFNKKSKSGENSTKKINLRKIFDLERLGIIRGIKLLLEA